MALDPRHWCIVPLALGVACGPGGIPLAEESSETGAGESTETDTSTTTSTTTATTDPGTDTADDPCENVDCPPNQYCEYGTCWPAYQCSDTYPCPDGGECIDGYCAYPECETDLDCLPGEICVYEFFCMSIPCEPPMMVEIPLPDAVQGPVLSLQFADVTGDNGEELVLLHANEVLVVDGDLATSSAITPGSDALVMVEGNDDSVVDVVLRSSVANQSRIMLGDGAGQFGQTIDWSAPGLVAAVAIDWPPGGARELLVQRSDDGSVAVLSNLSSTVPTLTPVPFALAGIDRIAGGRFVDGLVTSEAVAFSGCAFEVQFQQGDPSSGGLLTTDCLATVGGYLSYLADDILTVTNDSTDSVVRVYAAGTAFTSGWANVPGVFGGMDVATGLGVVLIGDGPPTRLAPGELFCQHVLDPVPPANRIAAGDVDGGTFDEIAVTDLGDEVSLWRNTAW